MSWTGVSNSYQGGATFSLSYNEDTKVITMTETRSQDASKYVSTISDNGNDTFNEYDDCKWTNWNVFDVNKGVCSTSLGRNWKDETGGFWRNRTST